MLPLMAAAGVSSLVVELFSRADAPAVQPMPRDMSLEIGLKISGKVDKLMGKIQVGGRREGRGRRGAKRLLFCPESRDKKDRDTGGVMLGYGRAVLHARGHDADRGTQDAPP